MITLQVLLDRLKLPLFLLSLFFILATFAEHLSHGTQWARWGGINWHRVLQLLDLREENTLATWFSSLIFLTTALSLALLGWGKSPYFKLIHWEQRLFQLAALGAVILSADEVASVHETVGKWFGRVIFQFMTQFPVEDKGFFWLPLLAPILLLVFLMVMHILHRIMHHLPNSTLSIRRPIYLSLGMALFLLPAVFLLEILEVKIAYAAEPNILTCFEETCEILGMYSLFYGSLLIAKQYQL